VPAKDFSAPPLLGDSSYRLFLFTARWRFVFFLLRSIPVFKRGLVSPTPLTPLRLPLPLVFVSCFVISSFRGTRFHSFLAFGCTEFYFSLAPLTFSLVLAFPVRGLIVFSVSMINCCRVFTVFSFLDPPFHFPLAVCDTRMLLLWRPPPRGSHFPQY